MAEERGKKVVTVLWQGVGRQVGKVLDLGTAQSGGTSARSGEIAMPDCC